MDSPRLGIRSGMDDDHGLFFILYGLCLGKGRESQFTVDPVYHTMGFECSMEPSVFHMALYLAGVDRDHSVKFVDIVFSVSLYARAPIKIDIDFALCDLVDDSDFAQCLCIFKKLTGKNMIFPDGNHRIAILMRFEGQ